MTDYAIEFSDMAEDKLGFMEEIMQKAPKGIFIDVGTRKGGSCILALNQPNSTICISVDPYGGKPFKMMEGHTSTEFSDDMGIDTMDRLAREARRLRKIHMHYRMPSHDFLELDHTLWVGSDQARLKDLQFSFVLLDGDHTDEAVSKEIELLEGRMKSGGIVLIDNTDWLSIDLSDWEGGRFDMRYKIY